MLTDFWIMKQRRDEDEKNAVVTNDAKTNVQRLKTAILMFLMTFDINEDVVIQNWCVLNR